jgi:hypothetical protein
LVRTILASRHFYSDYAFRQRIKGPVEYVLGAVRAVYRCSGEDEAGYRPLPQQVLVGRIEAMGQTLFAPPNVKGWPGGTAWLNTSTILERDNFAEALAMGTLWPGTSPQPTTRATAPLVLGVLLKKIIGTTAPTDTPDEPAPPRAFDPARLLDEEGLSRPEAVVCALLDHYLPGGVRSQVRAKLVAFVAQGDPAGPALARRVREAVHAILSTADYQLA